MNKVKFTISAIITIGLLGCFATLNSQETTSAEKISDADDLDFQSLVIKGPGNDAELGRIVKTYVHNNMETEARNVLVGWLTRHLGQKEQACNYCKELIKKKDIAELDRENMVLMSAFDEVEKQAIETGNGDLLVRLANIMIAGKTRKDKAHSIYFYHGAVSIGNLTNSNEVMLRIASTFSEMGRFEDAREIITRLNQDENSEFYQSDTTQQWIKYLTGEIERSSRIVTRIIDSNSSGADEYLPLTKTQPVYPETALKAGKEGYVVVEFTVATTGRTKDIKVIESTDSIFEKPVIDVVSNFLYMPRIVDGKPVEVPGIQNKISFVIP